MNKKIFFYLVIKVRVFLFFTILLFLISINFQCKKNNDKEIEINSIPIEISFNRFDQKFYNTDSFKLKDLKKKYYYLFPEHFDDSVWINRRKDTLQLLLKGAVEKELMNLNHVKNEINHLFKHIKHSFPKTTVPKIITLINNVDYQTKIIFLDTLILLSLDTYLGKHHVLYEGIPDYIRNDMDVSYLPSHIVDKFLTKKIDYPLERTFLSQMIYYGKKLYLTDVLLPHETDSIKIVYTKQELKWSESNELYIWKYFIEKELLYKTDPEIIRRFIDPSPFSKFYLEIDNQSPGRIGRWIGWQIVRSYMKKNPDTNIQDLIAKSSQKLFVESGYKPKL